MPRGRPSASAHGGPSLFDAALSPEGQAAVRRAWEAAQAPAHLRRRAPSPQPRAGAGRGLDPGAAAALLARLLPALAPWQLWDVVGALRREDAGGAVRGRPAWAVACGASRVKRCSGAPSGTRQTHPAHPRPQVSCAQLQLMVLLVAAAASEAPAAALHACGRAAHAAFCGGGCGAGEMAGLRACAALLGAPPARLHAAAERLGLGLGGGGGPLAYEEAELLLFAALPPSSGAAGPREQPRRGQAGARPAGRSPWCWGGPCT